MRYKKKLPDEDAIPMIIRSLATGTLVLELNVHPDEEFESPLLELDIDHL